MPDPLIRSMLPPGKTLLVVVAAPNEYQAIANALGAPIAQPLPYWTPQKLTSAADFVLSGVGKANAAGAASRCYDIMRHGALLSLGIGGKLPIDRPNGGAMQLGQVVAAEACVFADEGVETPSGYTDIAALGFPPGPFSGCALPVDPGLLGVLRQLSDAVGAVATVSTCSGTDARAIEVARRTGAIAECMEGAAVALAGVRMGVPVGELRVLSNTTGDRTSQRWDIPSAFVRLGEVTRLLVGRAD